MSWYLSSEEMICNKLESQQTVIFAFSKKIKELEANLDKMTTHLVSYEATIGFLKEALAHIQETSDDYDSGKYAKETLKKIGEV